MKSAKLALALMLLMVQLPQLQAATTDQSDTTPAISQSASPPEIGTFEKKLEQFIQAFDAIKVQRANKLKEKLMPDMHAEVQYLNRHIKQLKEQLKKARQDKDQETGQVQQPELIASLNGQLKALNKRYQRLSFIHQHIRAYPFQARNIKTAGVVRKDMLLEFVELMKANRSTYETNAKASPEPSEAKTKEQ